MVWYFTAHTIDCVYCKALNHGLLLSLFKFFEWENILNWLENSGLKSRFLFCLIFQVFCYVQANLPETSPFLSAQMALVSTFFQMFIVLGMYNYGCCVLIPTCFSWLVWLCVRDVNMVISSCMWLLIVVFWLLMVDTGDR